ncbi:hypothetical protein B0H14DRAFT_3001443 [Mycena olivaceomarginata]|nr:hypothetical protein B0H14DRAFT_3001443 [Mycena olivaceomarginata]
MAESHLGQCRAPLEDLPLDRFLPTPRAKLSGSSPTKGQIEKSIDSSPIPFRHAHSPFQAAMSPSHRSFPRAHFETLPSSPTRTPKRNLFMSSAEITSSPITISRHPPHPHHGSYSPLPGIGAFAIDDLPICTASTSPSRTPCDSPGSQLQSIHYPGFDVFVDASETVGLDAPMDEVFDTRSTADGTEQEEEKENVRIPR